MTQVSYSNISASSIAPALPARRAKFISRVMFLLILLTALQIVVGFLTYESSLTFDEAMWQYIGRNWFRHGLTPYSGGVDNKSPLIFAIYGISDKLFGVNFWFPRLLGICFQSAGLYYTYKIARRLMSERAGLIALFIYGFSILWHASGGKYVSYTESYAVSLYHHGCLFCHFRRPEECVFHQRNAGWFGFYVQDFRAVRISCPAHLPGFSKKE